MFPRENRLCWGVNCGRDELSSRREPPSARGIPSTESQRGRDEDLPRGGSEADTHLSHWADRRWEGKGRAVENVTFE